MSCRSFACVGSIQRFRRRRVPLLQSVEEPDNPGEASVSPRPPSSIRLDLSEIFEEETCSMQRRSMNVQQGVLWKRRDVFKNRWRPRWFILQADQGILTYYLLTSSVSDTIAASPSRVEPRAMRNLAAPNTDPNRNRTTSFDSSITDNTINYDVIPRGTIFLMDCKVSVNEALTNVRERLYIFTIEPPNNKESKVHLAARSAQARDAWIRQISRVCESLSAPLPPQAPAPIVSFTAPEPVANSVPAMDAPVDSVIVSDVYDDANLGWKSVDDTSDVYTNMSGSLNARIEQELATNLALCDQQTPDATEWQKLYLRGDGSAAYQKRNTSAQPTIMTRAQLGHPVKQVFNLLVDPSRRHEFESNVRRCQRIQVLSPHTFYDYYSYNAIWPSRPREFVTAVHWQLLQKEDERAIAIIAFSWDEASTSKPARDDHVRGTLFVNFTLLRQTGQNACHITKILSYSLGGGMPSAVSNYIIGQQVGSLRAVGDRLSRYEQVPSERLGGPLSRETIISDIIQRIGTEAADASSRRRQDSDSEDMSLVISESESSARDGRQVALITQLALLFIPLIIYHTAIRFTVPFPGLWFVCTVLLAVRQLVLLHCAGGMGVTSGEPLTGQIICRFKVDLKGVLRFLANKKEDRQPGSSEVSVVHIVSRACAVALKKHRLHTRHLSIPWLLIDKHVPCGDDPVSVSLVLEADSAPITIDSVDGKSVQEIADSIENSRRVYRPTSDLGSCLVFASHNFDDSDIETDAVSVDPRVNLVAVIGNVGLDRRPAVGSTPRPTLQLSLTLGPSTSRGTFSGARRLAEEIQKLIMYPEICDDA